MKKKTYCPASIGTVWFALLLGLLVQTGCKPSGEESQRDQSNATSAIKISDTQTNNNLTDTNALANLGMLKGKWVRPDGGYVIDVRQVDADGQLDAGYFNPNPIRVVKSVAGKEGPAIKVRLELNDVGYPGCKYDLTYIPEQDVLVGTYFQAALGETFEVAFRRLH